MIPFAETNETRILRMKRWIVAVIESISQEKRDK